LDLLDDLASVLGLAAVPVNWPLGNGSFFKGVYDRQTREVHLFERTPGGAFRAPVQVGGLQDALVREALPPDVHAQVLEEVELLDSAGTDFDPSGVLAGKMTPVFFGSAMNNFGVQLLLDAFLKMAPPPQSRSGGIRLVQPDEPAFSAFVFKIQANMNPRHRDRVAFLRIVSGCFRRDMVAHHQRTGTTIRLGNSQRLFARERETVNEAWAGDVVGIVGNLDFLIGDTVSEEPGLRFRETPRFAPECFAFLRNTSTAKYKRFRDGLEQLLKEGVAQVFDLPDAVQKVPLLGAVGPLQFEVMQYRMETEYLAECRIEQASWQMARWVADPSTGNPLQQRPDLLLPGGASLVRDAFGAWVVLLTSSWTAAYLEDKNPTFRFLNLPPQPADSPT